MNSHDSSAAAAAAATDAVAAERLSGETLCSGAPLRLWQAVVVEARAVVFVNLTDLMRLPEEKASRPDSLEKPVMLLFHTGKPSDRTIFSTAAPLIQTVHVHQNDNGWDICVSVVLINLHLPLLNT